MRRTLLLFVLLAALSLPVCAVDVLEEERQILQTDTLTEALPDEAQQALQDYSPSVQADVGTALLSVIRWAAGLSVSTLREAVQTASLLLTAALLCQLVRQNSVPTRLDVPRLTGALAMTVLFTANMKSMIALATSVLEQMQTYSTLLLPVMCSAAAASGAFTGAGALYMGSSWFFSLLLTAVRKLLLPLVYAFVGLSAAECAFPEGKLSSLRQLLSWCICMGLKGVMYVFTAYVSLTGLLSGSSDEAALHAAKSTLSAAIPVVGTIAADASEAVLQSARVLRAAAGTFGILAVLAVVLVPFFKIMICYLTMKLTAAIAALAAGKDHAALLRAQAGAMGYVLGMVGCAALMLLLSTCCFMKVAAGG